MSQAVAILVAGLVSAAAAILASVLTQRYTARQQREQRREDRWDAQVVRARAAVADLSLAAIFYRIAFNDQLLVAADTKVNRDRHEIREEANRAFDAYQRALAIAQLELPGERLSEEAMKLSAAVAEMAQPLADLGTGQGQDPRLMTKEELGKHAEDRGVQTAVHRLQSVAREVLLEGRPPGGS